MNNLRMCLDEFFGPGGGSPVWGQFARVSFCGSIFSLYSVSSSCLYLAPFDTHLLGTAICYLTSSTCESIVTFTPCEILPVGLSVVGWFFRLAAHFSAHDVVV